MPARLLGRNAAAGAVLLGAVAFGADEWRPTNVLLITSDDHGWTG